MSPLEARVCELQESSAVDSFAARSYADAFRASRFAVDREAVCELQAISASASEAARIAASEVAPGGAHRISVAAFLQLLAAESHERMSHMLDLLHLGCVS